MPLPSDQSKTLRAELEGVESRDGTSRRPTPAATISEIRTTIPSSTIVPVGRRPVASKPSTKKGSLFGGLFQKEPSMVALEQFSANVQARRTSISAKPLPPATSRKMPTFVPKVNSKWDGVPDAVREREKDRIRASRASLIPPRTDLSEHGVQHVPTRSRRGSSSRSWTSRSSVPSASPDNPSTACFGSDCTDFSVEGQRPISQSCQRPASTISSSSTSVLPAITSFSPDDIPVARMRRVSGVKPCFITQTKTIPNSAIAEFSVPSQSSTTIDSVPDLISTALPSPLEQSPSTPGPYEDLFCVGQPVSRNAADHFEINVGRKCHTSTGDAFLAGETKPFEGPCSHQHQPLASSDQETEQPRQRVDLEPSSSKAGSGWKTNVAFRSRLVVPRLKLELTRRSP